MWVGGRLCFVKESFRRVFGEGREGRDVCRFSNGFIRHEPWHFCDVSEDFRLKGFKGFDFGRTGEGPPRGGRIHDNWPDDHAVQHYFGFDGDGRFRTKERTEKPVYLFALRNS